MLVESNLKKIFFIIKTGKEIKKENNLHFWKDLCLNVHLKKTERQLSKLQSGLECVNWYYL